MTEDEFALAVHGLMEAAKPFADLVHNDGVASPYPSKWWDPRLGRLAKALEALSVSMSRVADED